MSQSNKVCLPPWPFKLSVKCDPPPFLSTHCAPTHTLSCNSHYNLHITKYFNLMSYCKQTSQISYTFITLGPLSIAICLQFVLNTPPPPLSISLHYGCTFSSLATKTPCLRKFQHNTYQSITIRIRLLFTYILNLYPFVIILFIPLYLLPNLLLTIPLLLSPPPL